MIIKSHIRGGYRAAADYLKLFGKNEEIRLVEISDPDAKNLDQAFHNMWTVASTTRAKKPLHHISINPFKDERLTDEQVLKIVKRCEEKYGYREGEHQRVIVEHVLNGRQHFHVTWNRVSLTTGRPVWPGHHWKKSKQAAREMERELGLKRPVPRRVKKLWANIAKSGSSSRYFGRYRTLNLNSPKTSQSIFKGKMFSSHVPFGGQSSKSAPMPPMRTVKRKLRKRDGNKSASGNSSTAPSIKKSLWLAALHTMQWQELSSRYAGRRTAVQNEPDDAKRESMLAAIEQEETSENASLAAKQQIETDADLAAQKEATARQQENSRSREPKP
jgi:hypothetical protein